MRTIPSILLPIALFIFCAECAHGKDGPASITKTVVSQPNDGVSGFLKVDYADSSSAGHPTTWQYRLHPSGAWSPIQTMGTAKELTGSTYYDVKFNPSGSDTVIPNPYNNVLVTADKLTILKLNYTR
jgi:hypothetical protein